MSHEHDYDLKKKIKISFKGMDYYIMPRYKDHYLDHEYERFSLQILKNNLGPESLFVDIGAHYGAYSLYAANAAGSQVVAIEPVLENFELLKENVTVNKLSKLINTFDYAASDSNGEAEFNIPWASDSAGFYNHPNAETIKKQKVTVRKIDDVLGGKKADLIKIDTEGHEIGVLKGLTKSLSNNPAAQLIIEINPPLLEKADESAESLLEYVKKLGKEIYMVGEDTFTMYRITDRLDSWPRYINEGNYANLYCVPAQDHQYLLFISHTAQIGGAEMAMYEQVRELRKKGFSAHVVLPNKGPLENLLVEAGISHSIIEGYAFWASPAGSKKSKAIAQKQNLSNMKAATKIAELAEDIGATGIVNNSIVNPWGHLAAKALGLPLVWMVHEYGDLDHNLQFTHGIEAVKDFMAETADAVICCSESVRQSVVRNAPELDKKIHTVYNLIDTKKLQKLAKEPAKQTFSAQKALKLCIIGTVSESKGQGYAIEAVHRLKEQGINAELLILGNSFDGYQARLKKQVSKFGLTGSVKFLGHKTNPYPYLVASDAVLVCSKYEAFGRVTAEAMVLGVPVIGANTGGTLEMIDDGKTGYLFNAADPKSLAESIERFIKNNPREVIENAKRKAANLLDLEGNTKKLQSLISKINRDDKIIEREKVMASEWFEAAESYGLEQKERQEYIGQLREAQQALAKDNAELHNLINELTHSRSWKITKPVRTTSSKLKKLRK